MNNRGHMSSRFSCKSEASASELLENPEEFIPRYLIVDVNHEQIAV